MHVVSTASLVCVVLAVASPADAHVRMFIDGDAPLAIRNAPQPAEDGKFSTKGPCGGSSTFGANTANLVKDGESVCATINYNGGHKTAANAFQARFACGAPSENDMKTGTVLTTQAGSRAVGVTSIPATEGNRVTEGYKFCVDLPAQNLAAGVAEDANERKCTLSILDQRDWGSCLDFQLAADPPPPPPPPPVNTANPADVAGVYLAAGCAEDCKQCCPKGYVAVKDDGTIVTKVSTDVDGEDCKATPFNAANLVLSRGEIARDRLPMTFIGGVNLKVNGTYAQSFEVKVVGTNVLLANNGLDEPFVCDNRAARVMSVNDAITASVFTAAEISGIPAAVDPDAAAPGEGTGTGTDPDPPADDDNTPYIAAAGVAAAGAFGFAVFKTRKNKLMASGRTSQYGVGNIPSMRMTGGQGSEQWRAVSDPESGREYYYNTVTHATSWTQPPGMAGL